MNNVLKALLSPSEAVVKLAIKDTTAEEIEQITDGIAKKYDWKNKKVEESLDQIHISYDIPAKLSLVDDRYATRYIVFMIIPSNREVQLTMVTSYKFRHFKTFTEKFETVFGGTVGRGGFDINEYFDQSFQNKVNLEHCYHGLKEIFEEDLSVTENKYKINLEA